MCTKICIEERYPIHHRMIAFIQHITLAQHFHLGSSVESIAVIIELTLLSGVNRQPAVQPCASCESVLCPSYLHGAFTLREYEVPQVERFCSIQHVWVTQCMDFALETLVILKVFFPTISGGHKSALFQKFECMTLELILMTLTEAVIWAAALQLNRRLFDSTYLDLSLRLFN